MKYVIKLIKYLNILSRLFIRLLFVYFNSEVTLCMHQAKNIETKTI